MNASPAPVEIDRLNFRRRDPPQAPGRRHESAARPERHDDRLEALGDEALRRSGDFVLRLDRHAGENGELGLVRREEARKADLVHVEIADCGRGVERGPDAVPPAESERRIDGLERRLELQQDEIAGLEVVGGGLDVGRREIAVRALDDEDEIVARWIDEDRRRAGRLPPHALNVRRADAHRLEVLQHALAQHVVADFRHHDDLGAELRRRNRLVGALAAVAHLEARRGDRLAPDRHALDIGHEIDVARADDADQRALCHLSLASLWRLRDWRRAGGIEGRRRFDAVFLQRHATDAQSRATRMQSPQKSLSISFLWLPFLFANRDFSAGYADDRQKFFFRAVLSASRGRAARGLAAGGLDGPGEAPRDPHILWLECFAAIESPGGDSIISALCGAVSGRRADHRAFPCAGRLPAASAIGKPPSLIREIVSPVAPVDRARSRGKTCSPDASVRSRTGGSLIETKKQP